MPTGAVCDLRDALFVNAVLVLPNGSTMYAKDISADNVTNAIYVRLLADRELTTEGNYSILFNVKLVDGVMYSTVAVNFANVTTNADAGYKEIVLSSNLEVTDYPHNVQRTGASPKVSPRQTWLVYNDEAKAYEDTGIPAEVNFGDYYTKEETDDKIIKLESEVFNPYDYNNSSVNPSEYLGTIGELLIVAPIDSSPYVVAKHYNGSIFVRTLLANGAVDTTAWQSRLALSNDVENGVVYPLLCTTPSESLGVNIGDIVAYVVFKNVEKFKTIQDGKGGATLYPYKVKDITYSPIIASTFTKVGNERLADSSVTAKKIADNSVTAEKIADNSVTSDALIDKSVLPEKTNFLIKGKNLYDSESENVMPGYVQTGSEPRVSPNYTLSDYISVEQGKDYIVSVKGKGRYSARFVAFFDADKKYLKYADNLALITPEQDGYVRLSLDGSLYQDFQMEEGSEPTSFEKFGYKMFDKYIPPQVGKQESQVTNLESFVGASGLRKSYGNFINSQSIELNDFPKDNKFGDVLCIRANIEVFNSISIGKQIGVESSYNAWLIIDNTNIYLYKGTNVNVPRETIAHNLTLTEFVYIELKTNKDGSCSVNINTLGGAYSGVVNNFGGNIYGFWNILSNNTTLNELKLSISNVCFRNPFWIFGASYESILTSARWLYYLPDFGVDLDKLFINGYSGRASDLCYADFLRALKFAKPKYVYWTMWGNGTAASLDTYIGDMLELSKEYGFELIIIDRPNSPTQDSVYETKNEVIAKYINLGVRYVNTKEALSNNPNSPDGWYPNYLSSDGSHPTELGARALAHQVVLDIPEIVQYR